MLKSYGIADHALFGILQYATDSHYQLACQRFFDITHEVCEACACAKQSHYIGFIGHVCIIQ